MKKCFKAAAGILLFAVAFTAGVMLERYSNKEVKIETIATDDKAEYAALTEINSDNNKNTAQNNSEVSEEVIDGKININAADVEILAKIDGIGEKMAQRIIDYRNQNGEFASIENIMDVSGIGEKKFESFKDGICVGATKLGE